jgi:Cys-rich repeat protein
MDAQKFDALIMAASQETTRRGLMWLISGGVVAAALAGIQPALAKHKRKRKGHKKGRKHGQGACAQLNQGCDAKQACCQGFECIGGVCSCPAGTVASGNSCVPPAGCASDAECGAGQVCQGGSCVAAPPPPECVTDNDCDNNEVCQAGTCVPAPECSVDGDCGDNEACQNGNCVCPEEENGRCIRRCEVGNDCPGASQCRNHFPEDSDFIEDGICVNDFQLCNADTCNGDGDCGSDEICVHTGCSGGSFRCFPFSVF